ncbi:MAG: hypothetical protein K2X87_30515 [Gemmataceae bacterium]|nr:hypothetical protein [Gemmataceae bacterium]
MNTEHLFPYLVRDLPNPDWADLAVPVGHGLSAVVFEDHESAAGPVHTPVSPDQLRAAGLTPAEAHRLALDNLDRFAEADGRLSIQMLGAVGDPVHFLLYSDHPRASACLRLPDLYDHSRDLLKADALCAVVPQRDSLVVFPDRGPAYRDLIVGKLRQIEADAEHPLSFGLFEVTTAGVRPLGESPT